MEKNTITSFAKTVWKEFRDGLASRIALGLLFILTFAAGSGYNALVQLNNLFSTVNAQAVWNVEHEQLHEDLNRYLQQQEKDNEYIIRSIARIEGALGLTPTPMPE